MIPQELIRLKRDKLTLSTQEIDFFVTGIADESVSEGQVAAFAMAVYFNGLNTKELIALTLAMRDSGDILTWEEENALPGPVIDKHSTGGIGDNVSLMLGPIIAACGGYVPMISGRGLGHTGGTLDKLDSIPGYNTQPDIATLRSVVRACGVAIVGQTAELAPADKRLYSIRDITATVESIDLITASILSKKLAAGLQGLVMDVKTGNGAFMAEHHDAVALAQSIVDVANGAGVKTSALITDMDQPLASAAGNAVEVREAVNFLQGKCNGSRIEKIVISLCAELLVIGELATDTATAETQIHEVINNGQALERFSQMVTLLGGPSDFVDQIDSHLPKANIFHDVIATKGGYISEINTRSLGIAVLELGGGRRRADDSIDYSVGLSNLAEISTSVETGETLATIHAQSEEATKQAEATVLKAYSITSEQPDTEVNLIFEIIRGT